MEQDDRADGFNRAEPLKSDLNSARYSAAVLAASCSIALATDSGNDGFITRDVALMTRMRGSPFAPKWRANVTHNSPRRLYGELMQIPFGCELDLFVICLARRLLWAPDMRTIRLVGIDPKSRMEISFALPSIVIRVWNGDQGRGHVDESLSVCEPSGGIACDRGRKSRASHSV
jgi:hypothetical protein